MSVFGYVSLFGYSVTIWEPGGFRSVSILVFELNFLKWILSNLEKNGNQAKKGKICNRLTDIGLGKKIRHSPVSVK